MNSELPRFLPNAMVALIPAAYAWQVQGWGASIAAYAITLFVLAGLGWRRSYAGGRFYSYGGFDLASLAWLCF